MIHQLRIYEIFDESQDAFHARFRDHAAKHGPMVGAIEDRTLRRTDYSPAA
jgi:hypothetical protein